MLEDGEPCHQSRRQRRTPRTIRVNRAKLLLQERSISAARQLYQRMRQIDDLIGARA
jgi:hypothetical protein